VSEFEIDVELDDAFVGFGQRRLRDFGRDLRKHLRFAERHLATVKSLVEQDPEVAHVQHLSSILSQSKSGDVLDKLRKVLGCHDSGY